MSGFLFSSRKKRQATYQSAVFIVIVILLFASVLYHSNFIDRLQSWAYTIVEKSVIYRDREKLKLLMLENSVLKRRIAMSADQVNKTSFEVVKTALVKFKSVEISNDRMLYNVEKTDGDIYVNASGLVGVRSGTNNRHDQFRPITDKGMMMPVVDTAQIDYLVEGVGYNKKLQVVILTEDMKLEVGDILYANPQGRKEFRGIPVARVSDIQQKYDGDWLITAEPIFWSSSLTHLFVVS